MKYNSLVPVLVLFVYACNSSKQLTKPDASLVETYWKVVEVMGKPVSANERQKEAHLILKQENARVQGNAGCNTIGGTYSLQANNRISFSQMTTTKMACPEMETESQLLKVFGITDSYAIKGDTLQLFRARMAPLARLQAVYLR